MATEQFKSFVLHSIGSEIERGKKKKSQTIPKPEALPHHRTGELLSVHGMMYFQHMYASMRREMKGIHLHRRAPMIWPLYCISGSYK
jgi:hypothetical protein